MTHLPILELPIKISIQIFASQAYINLHNVNTVDAKKELIKTLAQTLFDKYTGTQVSFYRTQIIDLIHNLSWVKSCIVQIFDNKNLEIPEGNFEIIPQLEAISQLDKFGAIIYCPIYFLWDLENISVDITYE